MLEDTINAPINSLDDSFPGCFITRQLLALSLVPLSEYLGSAHRFESKHGSIQAGKREQSSDTRLASLVPSLVGGLCHMTSNRTIRRLLMVQSPERSGAVSLKLYTGLMRRH